MARYVIQPERDEYANHDIVFRTIEGTKYVASSEDEADIWTIYDLSGADPVIVDDFDSRAEAEAALAELGAGS